MGVFRKTVLAASFIGVGLASTTGAAFANEGHHADQEGLANVDSIQTIVPVNACNNNIPVNVLGVQVPVQDVAGNIPILSGSHDKGGNSAGVSKSCGNAVKAENG